MTDIAARHKRDFTLAQKRSEWFQASPQKDKYLWRMRFVVRMCILSGA